MLTDVCPAGCRAILSRNKKRRATLSASYFGQLKAAGYLSWQPAPHKMGEGIRNPYGEQRTDSNRPSSRRPRTRPQMGTGVVSFHVFSKLERRTRHATAGCLVSVQAGGQTRGQTARTAGALGQGHAPTPGRLPGYGCGCENGGAHAHALAIIAAVAAALASAGLRYCTAARHCEAWESGCSCSWARL